MPFDTIYDLTAIIAFIIGIALYLENKPNILKNKLTDFFKMFQNVEDIVEWCKLFLKRFDKIYCEKNPMVLKFHNYIWAWIIICFIITVILGIINSYYGIYEIYIALFLGFFLGTILFIMYILFEKDLGKKLGNNYLYKSIFFLIIYPKCQSISLVNEKNIKIKPITKYVIYSYIMALSSAIFIFIIGLIDWFVYPWMISTNNFPIMGIFEMQIHTYMFILIILSLYTLIIFFCLFLFQYMVFYIVTKHCIFLKISPIRTMIISLLFMFIIFLIFDETKNSLFSDFNKYRWTLLVYLLLNIFADSFSILETRFIFQKAFSVNFIKSIFLLVLDIFASGFLFLIIPLSTGNLQVFLDALFFKGNSPWFGILFWSTFSTSIIFYIYVICFLCMTFLYKYSLIEKNIKEYPIYILGIIAIILTIFIFILKNILITNLNYAVAFIIIIILVYLFLKDLKTNT